MQSVQDFCDELQELLTTRHFTPEGVMNYDETWLVNKGGAMVTRRIHSASKEPSDAHSTRHSTVASLVTFLAANGNIFISVYVMKGKFVDGGEAEVDFRLHAAPRVSRRSWPRFSCWTETGFLDADTFNHFMDQVTSEWAIRNPSTNLLLFGDRRGAHMRPDTLEKALDRKVFLFFLPSNSSHWTQPLDASPFGILHVVTRSNNEQLVIDGTMTNTGTKDTLLASAFAAERVAFRPHIIREALRPTGLFLYDCSVIMARAKENLGVGEDGGTDLDMARSAAAEVIRAAKERVEAAAGEVRGGQASVKRAMLHSPEALLAQHREREAYSIQEAEEVQERHVKRAKLREDNLKEKADKVAARAGRTCQACLERKHRGGGGWHICGCGTWRVCPKCKVRDSASDAIAVHTQGCGASNELGTEQ